MENKEYLINPSFRRPSAKGKAKKLLKNPNVQYIIFGLILVLIQVIGMITGGGFKSFTSVIRNMMIYTILAIGFCFLLGYGGLASLGTAGFVGVGIYITTFMMNAGIPFSVALVTCIVAGVVFGIVIGFISLRINGMYLALVTLGLSEVMRYALKAIWSSGLKIKTNNIALFGITVDKSIMFFVVAVILVVLMILIHNLIKSPTGKATVAMKDSTSAAQAFGISLLKYRLLAFIVATVFATVGGCCFMLCGNSITPASDAEKMLKLTLSLNVLGAVIIGGYKSIWGSFIGTFIVFGLSDLFAFILPNEAYNVILPYISLIVGACIIIVVMFYPGGLAQLGIALKSIFKKIKIKIKEARYGKIV